MKQKHSLLIGDFQLNVVADADHEEVQRIAGILDRKMREIYLRSHGCSKNEAALLCALEFCSERMEMQASVTALEARGKKYSAVLEAMKSRIDEQEAELERLKAENAVLRSVIKDGEAPAAAPAPAPTATPVPPAQFIQEVADAQYGPAGEAAPADPVEEAPLPKKGGKKGRSRVGSMYDLLSFDEV